MAITVRANHPPHSTLRSLGVDRALKVLKNIINSESLLEEYREHRFFLNTQEKTKIKRRRKESAKKRYLRTMENRRKSS